MRRHGAGIALAHGPSEFWDAVGLLASLQSINSTVSFFLRDRRLPVSKAVQLARKGAAGVFGEESDESEIAGQIERLLVREDKPTWRRSLIGSSAAMERICSLVQLVS